MRPIVVILALAGMSAGQGGRTFTGVITDTECSTADHSHMRMGPTDAECGQNHSGGLDPLGKVSRHVRGRNRWDLRQLQRDRDHAAPSPRIILMAS